MERTLAEELLNNFCNSGAFVICESSDKEDIVLSVLIDTFIPEIKEVRHITLTKGQQQRAPWLQ